MLGICLIRANGAPLGRQKLSRVKLKAQKDRVYIIENLLVSCVGKSHYIVRVVLVLHIHRVDLIQYQ
jgi:hypothetical protein